MSFSKTLTVPGGTVTFSADFQQVSVAIAENAAIGGGQAAGVLSVKGNASAVLSEQQAVDLGFALIEKSSPAALVAWEQKIQALYDGLVSAKASAAAAPAAANPAST